MRVVVSLHANRSTQSGHVSRSVPVLVPRCRPGRRFGPGRLTMQVGAGDHPGKDAHPRSRVSCCSAEYAVARWSLDGSSLLALLIPLPAVALDAHRAAAGSVVSRRVPFSVASESAGRNLTKVCARMHNLSGSVEAVLVRGVRGVYGVYGEADLQIGKCSFETRGKQAPTGREQEALLGKCSFRRVYAGSLAENGQIRTLRESGAVGISPSCNGHFAERRAGTPDDDAGGRGRWCLQGCPGPHEGLHSSAPLQAPAKRRASSQRGGVQEKGFVQKWHEVGHFVAETLVHPFSIGGEK